MGFSVQRSQNDKSNLELLLLDNAKKEAFGCAVVKFLIENPLHMKLTKKEDLFKVLEMPTKESGEPRSPRLEAFCSPPSSVNSKANTLLSNNDYGNLQEFMFKATSITESSQSSEESEDDEESKHDKALHVNIVLGNDEDYGDLQCFMVSWQLSSRAKL